MAFTTEELGLIEFAKKNNKTRQETEIALQRMRSGIKPSSFYDIKKEESTISKVVKDIPSDFLQMGEGIRSNISETGKQIDERLQSDETFPRKIVGVGADAVQGIARTIMEPYAFGVKAIVTPEFEKKVEEKVEETASALFDTDFVKNLKQRYDELTPEEKTQVDNVFKFAEFPATVGSAGLFGKFIEKLTAKGIKAIPDIKLPEIKIPSMGDTGGVYNEKVQGVLQMGTEFVNRIRKAKEHSIEYANEASVRAQQIKSSTPAIKNAIEVGVDENLIQGITNVGVNNVDDMIKMFDIAEKPTAKLGYSKRPEIIAGEAISKQYEILDNQRKKIGKKIGKITDELDKKTGKIDVFDAQQKMRDILEWNGITVDKKGVLSIRAGFTPKQRSLIQQLYDESTRLGDRLLAGEIYGVNKTLSALQREAKFEGIGDVYVKIPDGGEVPIASVFREIYTKKLETIAPDLSDVNKQYGEIKRLLDDVDDSLVRSSNFNYKKGDNLSEYAKTNLRRIFSNATTAADYGIIANNVYEMSKKLGYKGSDARVLAAFGLELNKLFPNKIPETSLQGILNSSFSISGIADKVLSVGKPTVTDKQKAIKLILEELKQAQKLQ